MQSKDDVNIGEVCQQTGVAAVTLRAWERRYGIIKPKRTPKGHRLYTPANIEEIKQIVNWLNRGVAISKVAELIIAGKTLPKDSPKDESWQQLQQEVLSTLIALEQRSLNRLFEKLSKSMPFVNLCENIYQPLLSQLSARWQAKPLGYQLEQQLWQQCWQRQITVLTWRADKQKPRANCCLVNLDKQDSALDYWLFYALLLQSGIQTHAFNQIDDLGALPRLRNSLDHPLIIFGDNKIATRDIDQVIKTQTLSEKETIVIGRVADIHQNTFANLTIDHIGGDATSCWQSTYYQSWLERMIAKQ
jgi:DNA-binding transcriptional MerR regulator